jgi:hypothetical protein
MLRHLFAAGLAAGLVLTLILAPAGSPAQAQTPAAQAEKPTVKKKIIPAGLAAARERQKQCGVEWKEAKAGGKVAKDMTWPKFWSACNTRLKKAAT